MGLGDIPGRNALISRCFRRPKKRRRIWQRTRNKVRCSRSASKGRETERTESFESSAKLADHECSPRYSSKEPIPIKRTAPPCRFAQEIQENRRISAFVASVKQFDASRGVVRKELCVTSAHIIEAFQRKR